MIRITTQHDKVGFCALEVKGHSGYAQEGNDIVCSAVSTLVITCANALQQIAGIDPYIEDEPEKPRLFVALPTRLPERLRHDAQIIMDTTLLGLRSVAESEPKYLQIK